MKLCWLAAAALLLTACGGSESGDRDAPSRASLEAPGGELLEYGFGQEGQYVQVLGIVKNLDEDSAGQTVTLSVNLLDESDQIVATEHQVTSFTYQGQTTAVSVFVDLGQNPAQIASVDPTLLVEDDGVFSETPVDFGTVGSGPITQVYGNDYETTFLVPNPTDQAVDGTLVAVCRNAAGDINGGDFAFPELVDPGGEVLVDSNLTVTGEPKTCTAYLGGEPA